MIVTYDRQVDAMYIAFEKIRAGGVKQTISLNEDIVIDLDRAKKIIGIEIMGASKNLAKKGLDEVEKISAYA